MQTKVARRRTGYSVLIGIILLTIPCYLIGFAALFILQRPGLPVLGVATPTPQTQPTQTSAPTPTLGEIPTQFVPPTVAPTQPLDTTTPLASPAATATLFPTLAPATPTPTAVPIVTVIVIPPETPTIQPTPDFALSPTPIP